MTKPAYRKFFVRILKSHFPELHFSLMTDTDLQYQIISKDIAFVKTSSNPMDKRIEFCGYILSLIRVLEIHNQAFEKIREICLEVTIEYVRPKTWLHKKLRHIPVILIGTPVMNWFIPRFNKKISTKGHEDGFRSVILTKKEETLGLGYGVDILECGICKLFAKHQALHFAPILCEVDKITTALAGLSMTRSGTIATGSSKCDFRYQRVVDKNNVTIEKNGLSMYQNRT